MSTTKTIKMKIGEVYIHKLKGNPTTGYEWSNEVKPDNIIKIERSFNSGGDQLGVGGVYSFQITALAKGNATVVFTYKQPWNSDDKNTEKLEMQFQVTD